MRFSWKWLLLFVFLSLGSNAYSQENRNIQELESLADKYVKEGKVLELSRCQAKLGFLYKEEGNFARAIEFYQKALQTNQKLGNRNGIKSICNNLGMIYSGNGDNDLALEYFDKSLKIDEDLGKKPDILSDLINIAQVKQNLKNYDESNQNLERASSIAQELGDLVSLKNCYFSLAENYERLGNLAKSKECAEIASSIRSHLQKNDLNQAETRTKLAESEVSLKNLEIISKEDKIKEINRQKELTSNLLSQQKELTAFKEREFESKESLQKAKQKSTYVIIASLGFILLMAFALLLFIVKQLRDKKKANALLEQNNKQITEQKREIEMHRDALTSQKKKITDSILYAQRIQNAVLPPISLLEKALPEHFILYRPKDIVSGDFYWMSEKEGFVVIAAVDCTGHGVPGAFMSMLGVAALNDIINKSAFNRHFRSLTASEILNQLREHIIQSLHQAGSESENKDGMDISLVIIDFQGMHLQFAGAHNPLYVIRNGELIQFPGDPMPIGVYKTSGKPFTNHELDLRENDLLYLFTDGYYDQFGGSKGIKMMSANFRNYLLEICHQPMLEQKRLLEEFYDTWKGKRDQMDDVTVIGFRFQPLYKISNAPQYKLWKEKRILIAEDVDLNFLLLVEALRPTKAKIFRVENGSDAVEYCRKNEIDLVFMDIHMPIMNGIDATKLIKEFKPDLPIVAQTAIGSKEDIEEIMNAGCCDYISKPIDLKAFFVIVRKYLLK